MVVFDPYMGSRPLAEALVAAPQGELVVDNQYYAFSSVFFYTNHSALLLNGRVNNVEYGSYAPALPMSSWTIQVRRAVAVRERRYLLVEGPQVPRIEKLVGKDANAPRKSQRR